MGYYKIYKIVIRYWDWKWKRITERFEGYSLDEAIELVHREHKELFEKKNGYIADIFVERHDRIESVDW